jgi:hypothetical protein
MERACSHSVLPPSHSPLSPPSYPPSLPPFQLSPPLSLLQDEDEMRDGVISAAVAQVVAAE